MSLRRLACCLLLFCLPWLAAAAEVQASLDRQQVSLGETVTLNLRVFDGSPVDVPDLSALTSDFVVLGTSSNTSISIVNGKRSAELTYGVALRPRRSGRLAIPALHFAGGTTAPLSLEVTAPDRRAAAQAGKEVFLEAVADPAKAYVGEQMSFVVRLYVAGDLSSGALEDPQVPGADLNKLGGDVTYQAQRGDRLYNIVERHYALIPQQPGHIEIPPVSFQGELIDMADPDSFFGSTRPMAATSAPVAIEVAAVPAGAGKTAWLPARALSLSLEAAPGELHVGQTLELTMAVQATGLPYEALPALSLPVLDGATVYPDKPVNSTRANGSWLLGRRQQTFAVVPDRPGTLRIPETTLTWWNVQANKQEVARIPARQFKVLPAVGAAAAVGVAPAASQAKPPVVSEATPPPAAVTRSWREIAPIAAGVLLLAGVLAWLGLRRARPRSAVAEAAPSPARPRAVFLAAVRGGDTAAQARALLAWAKAERPGLANLSELAAMLDAEAQRAAIEALQRAHYAGVSEAALGERLAFAFRSGFAWRGAGRAAGPQALLPPLYPFKLD
jgi:hypothetical protein